MAGTAIFDLDRTITRHPTWTRFLIFVNGHRLAFWLAVPMLALHGLAHKLGLASRDSVKVRALRSLTWLGREKLDAAAEAFIAREIETGLWPGAAAAIRWHAAQGHHLVVCTASVDLYVDKLARALGFHQVIATRLDWTADARHPPPRLAGANCYGAEKLKRLAEFSFAGPVYAYSDHISDLGMLLQGDHAIAVNPSAGLRRAANEHPITVVDFASADLSFLEPQGPRAA
ncbi:MAG: HAD-IB family hydrolase [Hyphomonas sp.]|jgi:phosphatidylglycerophosphatase C|nr:HAD-IB family hydrolase [Hyphomonas sp.]